MIMDKQKRNWKPKMPNELGFISLHFLPFLAIWTGATWFDWTLCIALYFIRMFFITGFYHRYFSHKSYKTSRVFQFIMAFLAETSLQKGALWWAANHRTHHLHSDQPEDPHSAKLYGFWYSHIGWIIGPDYKKVDISNVSEFKKFSELLWINKHYLVPPMFLAVGVYFAGCYFNAPVGAIGFAWSAGLSTLLIGFALSTVVLYHGTFTINSLTHMFGSKRYESNDESRNNLLLSLITLGEGWHNNHHYYQSTAKAGFFWWEIDPTYYMLKLLSYLGIIWDLKPVPKHIKYSKNLEEAKALRKSYEQ
jgi:stearoyl-CoA desaturase (delta-9 desaturase)